MKIFALLVGINNYPFKPLRGCINDINAVEKFLKATYQPEQLEIKKLLDGEATRQGLIDAFSWFEQAAKGDTCLFYYSGHGSYMPAAKEFWTETDGNLETLVCVDSRLDNGRDLTNKELGFLIWQYSRKNELNFVVITDSCHSGSVTREMVNKDEWRADRTEPTSGITIPVEEFYGFNLMVNGEKGYIDEMQDGNRRVSIRVANHIHLAASRDNQTAKEDEIIGEHQGIFTNSLLRTLYANNAKINYQSLISSTSSKVKSLAFEQNPSLNIIGWEDSARSRMFLNNELLMNRERIYKVFFDKKQGWSVNGGGINDFQVGDKVIIEEVGEAKISIVGFDISSLSIPINLNLTRDEYDAKVIKNKRIPVSFGWLNTKWDWEEDKKIIKEKAQSATDFYLVDDDSGVFFIQEQEGKMFLTPKNSTWALFKKINWNQTTAMDDFVEKIDTACRWYSLKDLNNPQSSIEAKDIKINIEEIGVGEAKANEDGYFFYYHLNDEKKWKEPQLKISVINKSKIASLIVQPIYLGFDYSVDTSTFNQLTLNRSPENITFTSGRKTEDILTLSVDTKYQALGYNQITEYLKIFVSTKQLEIDGFSQEGIELEQRIGEKSRDLEQERNERMLGKVPDDAVEINDWQVFTVKLTVTRPTEVQINAQQNLNEFGFKLVNNSLLKAKIGISTTDEIKQRGLRDIKTPQLLHETKGNDIFTPAELVPNHGQGQSLNVIEIFDAQHKDSVKDETPLIVEPSVSIDSNETIIPFGFDPETKSYFPLGTTNANGQIVINQLPQETPSDALITQRSFLGSIKIYFYKIIGQKIGLKYDYPELSIADVDELENLTYVKDFETIKDRVSKAQKIVLFIHGIIGDTEEMTKAVRRAKTPKGELLADKFDLVLAFDYENLNTKIQETARDLQKRLTAAGLGDNHDKELVIISHSMGGLICRYFIEKLGGDKIVSRLIMLGTPNGGSEWADVRDLAEVLLATAANGAAFLKPWLIPLSFVGKLLKGTQITLQQMNDKGDLSIIGDLNDGIAQKIPYCIIAGNTKLLGNSAEIDSWLQRTIARIKEKPVYAALDIAVFSNAPNDIAVKVSNIEKINLITPSVTEAASDHISYFSTPDALEKLGKLFI